MRQIELNINIVNDINTKLTNIINLLIQYKIVFTDLKANNVLINYDVDSKEIIDLVIADISFDTVCHSSTNDAHLNLLKIELCNKNIKKTEIYDNTVLLMYEFLLYFYYHLFYIYILFKKNSADTSILFNNGNLIYYKLSKYTDEQLYTILNTMDDLCYSKKTQINSCMIFAPHFTHMSNFIMSLLTRLRLYLIPYNIKTKNEDVFNDEFFEGIFTITKSRLILYFMRICVTDHAIIINILKKNSDNEQSKSSSKELVRDWSSDNEQSKSSSKVLVRDWSSDNSEERVLSGVINDFNDIKRNSDNEQSKSSSKELVSDWSSDYTEERSLNGVISDFNGNTEERLLNGVMSDFNYDTEVVTQDFNDDTEVVTKGNR